MKLWQLVFLNGSNGYFDENRNNNVFYDYYFDSERLLRKFIFNEIEQVEFEFGDSFLLQHKEIYEKMGFPYNKGIDAAVDYIIENGGLSGYCQVGTIWTEEEKDII